MAKLIFNIVLLIIHLVILLVCNFTHSSSVSSTKLASTATAIFIFGDSSVDPGNNNYIKTTPENRANYKPYGQNGFFEEPTGRFSDGRVIVDFIAERANLPIIPPFLQPSAEFTYGANFASGGAGVLTETNQGVVIDLQTQLNNFQEVQQRLTEKLGAEEAEYLISDAVYLFCIGNNDYMGGYLGSPKMREDCPPEEFVRMVIGNLTSSIQVLHARGARKFAFISLPPLGCLPALRALNSKDNKDGCYEEASQLALAHNNAFSSVLGKLEHMLKGFKYCNSDFYGWLSKVIQTPSLFGFKDGANACCGTGPYRGVYSCGGTKEVADYQLCDNVTDYVWWDSFHPTEKIHEQFAEELWNGRSVSGRPFTLEELFFDKEKVTIGDVVDEPEALQY